MSLNAGPDRDRLLALWAVNYADFNSLIRVPIPKEPRQVAEWNMLSKENRKHHPLNWEDDEIRNWLQARSTAVSSNEANIKWLDDLEKWLDKEEDKDELMAVCLKKAHFKKDAFGRWNEKN